MEVVNVDGGTPLHAALINNENDCIDVLLEAERGKCKNGNWRGTKWRPVPPCCSK